MTLLGKMREHESKMSSSKPGGVAWECSRQPALCGLCLRVQLSGLDKRYTYARRVRAVVTHQLRGGEIALPVSTRSRLHSCHTCVQVDGWLRIYHASYTRGGKMWLCRRNKYA